MFAGILISFVKINYQGSSLCGSVMKGKLLGNWVLDDKIIYY